jgi:hypothetical protein
LKKFDAKKRDAVDAERLVRVQRCASGRGPSPFKFGLFLDRRLCQAISLRVGE